MPPRLRRAAPAAVPALALLAACESPARTVDPAPAAPRAAAASAAPSALGTRSVLAKGFALVRTPAVEGRVTDPERYNAAGAVIEWLPGANGRLSGVYTHDRLTFGSLASVLGGPPHVQLAQVITNPDDGVDVFCAVGATRVAENGADVETFPVCVRDRLHVDARPSRVDSRVSALVLDRDAEAAFATVRPDGAAENGSSRLTRAERVGVGRYRVFFRRDPLFGAGARPVAFVTARHAPEHCQLFSIGSRHQRADEFGVEVDCHAPGGARRDARFNVLALAQTPKTGHAFVRASGAVDTAHTSNPAGAVFVEHPAPGLYRVGFVGLQRLWADGGAALVTAHGASGERCALEEWRRVVAPLPSPGMVHASVECRDAAGAPADAGFTVLATTGR